MPDNRFSFFVGIFSRFTYSQKFIIISIIFVISILTGAFFMVSAQNSEINFTMQEIKGNEYQRAIFQILQNLPRYRQLSERYLNGDKSVKSDLLMVQTEINTAFRNLLALDKDNEKILNTTPADFQLREYPNLKPTEIEKKWNELVQQQADTSAKLDDNLHMALLDDLKTLYTYIGDTSNLNFDPNEGSAYLIDSLLYYLSEVQKLVPQISLLLWQQPLTGKHEINEDKKIQVAQLLALLSTDLKKTKQSLERAAVALKNFDNLPDVENKLKDPIKDYLEIAQKYISYLQKYVFENQMPPSDSTEYFNLSNRLLKENVAVSEVISEQLAIILKQRLHILKLKQAYGLSITAVTAIIAFFFGLFVMREISRPLSNLVKAAKNLANGDLSTRVPVIYQDEIGQLSIAFNQMAESFQELIGQLQWAGIQLTTSTTEIAAAAKQQEATVIEQEATTKQIAVTAREISTTAKDFAKTMNDVSNTAEQTSALANAGKAGLSQMESIMHQMVEASGNIASKLAVLSEKAGNITSVVTTITKVADQTNLLSLNAAIEAEKAGEHGRSFAVIAREIRRLADQTANATLDIEKMVTEIVSAVSAGVMGVDKFSEEIHTGVKQVSTVSEQLSKIIEQVQLQTTSFENVNQGMQAQSLGAEQINESIVQLSEAVQQTTESIRQFHKAIEQLNNAAQEMQTAVIKLKR